MVTVEAPSQSKLPATRLLPFLCFLERSCCVSPPPGRRQIWDSPAWCTDPGGPEGILMQDKEAWREGPQKGGRETQAFVLWLHGRALSSGIAFDSSPLPGSLLPAPLKVAQKKM